MIGDPLFTGDERQRLRELLRSWPSAEALRRFEAEVGAAVVARIRADERAKTLTDAAHHFTQSGVLTTDEQYEFAAWLVARAAAPVDTPKLCAECGEPLPHGAPVDTPEGP